MITQLGGYRIEARIGKGGFGDVYGAIQTCLDRRVAVKTLHPEFAGDPARIASFLNQAKLTAKLEHQNIVRVYDYGCENDIHYIAMQFVDGQTLESLLFRRGCMAPSEVIYSAKQIADALDFAHKRGVVHGDLNPGNIIFGEDGMVYVTDFGAASPTGGRERLVGVPEYVSPEQARGEDPVPASDVYSLGILMYHMLCGRPPFADNEPRETLNAHICSKVPVMKGSLHRIHPKLVHLVMRLLAKRPEDRPDAGAIRDALMLMTPFARSAKARKVKKVRQPMSLVKKLAAAMILPVSLGCWLVGAMIFTSIKTESAIDELVEQNADMIKTRAETERKMRIRAEYTKEMVQGKKMYESRQFGLAEASFKRASHLEPKSTDPRMFLAALYIDQGKYDRAEWHLKRILQLDPDNREAVQALQFIREQIQAPPVELTGQ